MHIVFAVLAFLAGSVLTFFIMRAKSAGERGEADALKSRLAEAETVKTEAESCRVAAAKALATLESLEKQVQHERELVSEAHERELRNLRETHAGEVEALRERFRNELADKLKLAEEQKLAQSKAFETQCFERDVCRSGTAVQRE